MMSPEIPSSAFVPYILNEQETTVFEALRKHYGDQSPLHEWYLGALEALLVKNHDYFAQAAHSIREITDQLPSHAGIPLFESPLPKVRDLGEKFTRIKTKSYPDGWKNELIQRELSEFLESLDNIYRTLEAPPRTARLRLALTKQDPGSNDLPENFQKRRNKAFKRLGEYFQNVAHHKHTPSETEFRENLNEFETILITYLTPVTTQQQREILAIISRSPDADGIEVLHQLLLHNSANYALVIEKLEHPEWLPILEKLEFFTNPPGAETSEGGTFIRSWPSLQLLARFADKSPNNVLHILQHIPPTPNPLVHDQILRCLSKISNSENSEAQLQIAKRCLKSVGRSGHIWIEELLKNWIQRGNDLPALNLIREFLRILIQMDHPGVRDEIGWSLRSLDESCFAPLSSRRPTELCDLMFRLLESIRADYQKDISPEDPTHFLLEPDPPNDPPTYWIDDFFSSRTYDHQIESVLACRLYQIGKLLCSTNRENEIEHFDSLLRSSPWHLFKRIRWQVYADTPDQSLGSARRDVLELIHQRKLFRSLEKFELAVMLEKLSMTHGQSFLSNEEVEHYVGLSLDLSDSDREEMPETRMNQIFLKRLHPVRTLLSGAHLELYNRLAQGRGPLELEDYKPFRSRGGTVLQVAPKEATQMAVMSDAALWEFLNTWQPGARAFSGDDWLQEESPRALGIKFAELLESQPERFLPDTHWWRNLTRPECLSQPLERAAHRIAQKQEAAPDSCEAPPTDQDWQNWFGLAHWIAESAQATLPESREEERPNWHWNWPCMLTISFLKTAAKEPKFEPLPELKATIGPLLAKFAEMPDPQLVETTRHWLVDWLTTAINSMRGTAMEGLLDLAVQQKTKSEKRSPEPWIFETLERVLRVPDQSPAIFGLMGARANLLLYLFDEQLKNCDGSTLLLPPASFESRAAFVTAHYRYSSAFPQLLTILPNLPQMALDVLEQFESETKPPVERGQGFAHRLGVHLAHYFWNAAYRTDEKGWATLDRFFQVAKPSSRAKALVEIGRLFSPIPYNEQQKGLFERAMSIWDRRVTQILPSKNLTEFYDELGAFSEWISADCFPFEWRNHHFIQVLRSLPETPKMFRFMEMLRKVALDQGHLSESLHILSLVISKSTFPEFGWTYRDEELKAILQAGLHAPDPQTRQTAEEVRELLLRNRCFEYLELE